VADDVARQIPGAPAGIRFAPVEIAIHEGRVAQMERKEKVRLDKVSGDQLSKGHLSTDAHQTGRTKAEVNEPEHRKFLSKQ
jgi:hypothetical protein